MLTYDFALITSFIIYISAVDGSVGVRNFKPVCGICDRNSNIQLFGAVVIVAYTELF